ncbi:MAG: 16S rRNA (cytidine(1402)-2'-O)-methyltransferase [Methylococcales bacterium]|nr:16S rRNA (cytidine(1402)-2'-O)-methyltransferase [Methylococcales bacterium]
MSESYGELYVVATPIGNLADFSYRAVDTLRQVELIAAEDTRHVKILLQQYGITTRVVSLHQHNEAHVAPQLVEKIQQGLSVALVSDAGTPLLSDPGMPLVRLAKEQGVKVSPIPGACAVISALSVAGLPINRFCFEGFLPRTSNARQNFFSERLDWSITWVFYESSHRILACLEDMVAILPLDRVVVIAREMTKLHETIVKDTLVNLLAQVKNDPNMQKGEFVVIVEGVKIDKKEQTITKEQTDLLQILLSECSIKTAASLAAQITGIRKKTLYQQALLLKEGVSHD